MYGLIANYHPNSENLIGKKCLGTNPELSSMKFAGLKDQFFNSSYITMTIKMAYLYMKIQKTIFTDL